MAYVPVQNLILPQEGFPAHLFVRDGYSKESPEDRTIPDIDRWDFAMSGGELVRDDRPKLVADVAPSPFDVKEGQLVIPAGATADFSCYYNMLSSNKWFDLTFAEGFTLMLELAGDARIDMHAYKLLDMETLSRVHVFAERLLHEGEEDRLEHELLMSASASSLDFEKKEIAVGNPDATLLGFSITAKTEVRIRSGAWLAKVDESRLRDVDLCIATTTFQKEEFITRNVRAYQQMMAQDVEMAEHLRIIVVDNGRTLDPSELEDANTFVFGNDNVGGAGGFARGMMEALKFEKQPTHIIIMDDDVLVLPEALKRTYALLRMLKPEWQDSYISGAMLRLENRDIQHEDIGYIDRFGFYAPKKPVHRLSCIVDCAFNEVNWIDRGHEYAAWWFCCMPMRYITPESLPVPFFVRGDDVEFGLRSDAPIISMNGIGVWHMGFGGKFSAQMEYYQVLRNSLIIQAFHPECADVNFFLRCEGLFNSLVSEFAYDYAELILDAMEDYLQGPSIIEKPNGLEVIKEKGKVNEKLAPLGEVFDGDADFAEVFDGRADGTRVRMLRRKFTTFTLNRQLFFNSTVRDRVGFVPYDWEFMSYPVEGASKIVSINPNDLTGAIRERDQERFAGLLRRKLALFDRYKAENERVSEEYRKAYPRLTSEEFWTGYLGLDEGASKVV